MSLYFDYSTDGSMLIKSLVETQFKRSLIIQWFDHINSIWNAKFPFFYNGKNLPSSIHKENLEDSTWGDVYILTILYANFEASFKLFLTSMKVGESDATQPFLAVMLIFVKTIVLLFPQEIKNCDCTRSWTEPSPSGISTLFTSNVSERI